MSADRMPERNEKATTRVKDEEEKTEDNDENLNSLMRSATSSLESERCHRAELEGSLLFSSAALFFLSSAKNNSKSNKGDTEILDVIDSHSFGSNAISSLPSAVRDAFETTSAFCRLPSVSSTSSSASPKSLKGPIADASNSDPFEALSALDEEDTFLAPFSAGDSNSSNNNTNAQALLRAHHAAAAAAAAAAADGGSASDAALSGSISDFQSPGQLAHATRTAALNAAFQRAVQSAQASQQQHNSSWIDAICELSRIGKQRAAAVASPSSMPDPRILSSDALLQAFDHRFGQIADYHARHSPTTQQQQPQPQQLNPQAPNILSLPTITLSSRKRLRWSDPIADGYDLSSVVSTEVLRLRGPTTSRSVSTKSTSSQLDDVGFSPEEVMGKYLDLTFLHLNHASSVSRLFSETQPNATENHNNDNRPSKKQRNNETSNSTLHQHPIPYIDFLVFLSSGFVPVSSSSPFISEHNKLHHRKIYGRFLIDLYRYLRSFVARTSPLLDVDLEIIAPAIKQFDSEWSQTGGISGWKTIPFERIMVATNSSSSNDDNNSLADLSKFEAAEDILQSISPQTVKAHLASLGLKCGGTPLDRAKRLFMTKNTPLHELPKKCFAKGRAPPPPPPSDDIVGSAIANKNTTKNSSQSSMSIASPPLDQTSLDRRIDLARLEYAVLSLLDQLRPILDATIRRSERRLTQTQTERERELLEELTGGGSTPFVKNQTSDDDDDDDNGPKKDDDNNDDDDEMEEAPIYNPKGVPLGWDGKPIPYWLFKLHGLNHFFPCEICGNESYRGRRNFEKHFTEAKHSFGMKCLGIPNTKHFHGITKIEDAQDLWNQLKQQTTEHGGGNSNGGEYSAPFDPEQDEEYEDSRGNVLNRAAYEDLARQGML